MSRVFDVGCLQGVPGTGERTVLLTARRDIDLATEQSARAQIRRVMATGQADAVLIDLTHAFVGVAVLRCLRDVTRQTAPVAVIGAPHWLPDLTPQLELPTLPYRRTLDCAIVALRNGAVTTSDRR